MATRQLPDADLLRKLLRYDGETGKLYWRERTPDMFPPQDGRGGMDCLTWNAKFANEEAFTARTDGYQKAWFTYRGERHVTYAHRIVWCMAYGEWPGAIDHINQDRSDNRLSNLRQTDHEGNARNCRLSARNRSGRIGVFWNSGRGKWESRIRSNGRDVYLGAFTRLEDACEARSKAEKRYGYDPQHGKRRKT